ncbi:MAG: TIGR00269 family protein [archaeon]|nr:MAG: TIGR00269 family protein [archaeon]
MKKCRCGKRAVIFRKHEGRALCKYHFMESIEQKMKKTIGKNKMIKPGDKIAVALTGGKDSAVVLYILNKIIKPRRDIELFAITVDEGIGGYSKPALKKSAALSKKFGIRQHVFSFKKDFGTGMDTKVRTIKKHKSGLKEPYTYCAVGRRYILNKEARKLRATKIATGHNLDDEAQGVLMNYIRGDMFRAARMGPVTDWSLTKKKGSLFVPRIRPIREIPGNEVSLYIRLKGLDVFKGERPLPGGIREGVEKFLNRLEKKYAGIEFSILHTFDKILPSIRKGVKGTEGEIRICKKCGEPGSGEICEACELWRS